MTDRRNDGQPKSSTDLLFQSGAINSEGLTFLNWNFCLFTENQSSPRGLLNNEIQICITSIGIILAQNLVKLLIQ